MFSRISTKDLYITECVSFYDQFHFKHFTPPRYAMVRKTGKYYTRYIDAFTKTVYQPFSDCFAKRGATVVYDTFPITEFKSYITKRYAKNCLKD